MSHPVTRRSIMTVLALATAAIIGLPVADRAMAQVAEPRIKKLKVAADPLKQAVLVGRNTSADMVLQLEIEGAEAMWMQMGTPPTWGAHTPNKDERYHVEFKLTDPKSKTRIPYAAIVFNATNTDTGQSIEVPLAPMWGASGLHYSGNSALLGDGAYASTVTVDVPTFQREVKDKDLWSKPVTAKFHFRMKDGKLTEVSEIVP